MLKRARIVLVDEASSALDPENEAAITQAIANLGDDPDRTVIVIAHHPAIVAAADHMVSLDAGQVAESGTPEELLNAGGAFARLSRRGISALRRVGEQRLTVRRRASRVASLTTPMSEIVSGLQGARVVRPEDIRDTVDPCVEKLPPSGGLYAVVHGHRTVFGVLTSHR